ncbi:thioredoxin-like protein [Aureobasidium namibiae CBS 147.97]|uniref:Thioredoxin-like protein n=1 Tax=Aureobasidium namibiae CBS 147.97 TaxID=1043004 RepID=A0A074WQK4_9PEZI
MSTVDPRVAAVLDHTKQHEDSDDEDALIAELEEDEGSLAAFREQRLQQLHGELARAKAQRNSDYGTYTEIKEEKQLMDITTSAKLCVVHFMKPDFNRCRIMDQKLAALAPKHFDTRFLSINVENAPFLVVKLKIQVLPCVLNFINGVSSDRIVGFEGIGYKPDSFTLQELEARLLYANVLLRSKMVDEDEHAMRSGALRSAKVTEDYDDDEWD